MNRRDHSNIRQDPGTAGAKPYQFKGFGRFLIPLVICGAFLAGLHIDARAQVDFDRHEIVTGVTKTQTILTGFFLGDDVADLAVIHIGEKSNRHLRFFALEGKSWTLKLETSLRPGVLFVDVAKIGGRDRLISYEPGRLNWFDSISATEYALVSIDSRFKPSDDGYIPQVDITRDLNGDGHDDLVFPGADGFQIFVQKSNGTFAAPLRIGPPEPFLAKPPFGAKRTYGEIGWNAYSNEPYQKRLHEIDFNRDGRNDLVFWNKDHFDVYQQNDRSLFDPAPKTFTTGAAFDTDGVYSLVFRTGKEKRLRVLHSFGDINGDRVADIVTFSAKDAISRGSLNRRRFTRDTRFHVYYGTAIPGATSFGPDVGLTVRPGGYNLGMQLHDLDLDGRDEMIFTTFRIGVYGFLRVVAAKKVSFELKFYKMDAGNIPKKPNTVRKFKSGMDPFDDRKESFFPFSLIEDVTGDKRADLLMAKGRNEMHIFSGVVGPDLFARRPQKIKVDIPIDVQYTRLVDLNKDGKQDILMHHSSKATPHRLTILIAR